MKDKGHSLLYHTMHSRPMPGCLPLFFLLAMVVVGVGLWVAPVEMPERVKPKGVGKVYKKEGRLADFVLRRQSPLPLHLPLHADPEYREDLAAASMPLLRESRVLPPPPQELFDPAADSAVLDAASLLELPPLPSESAPVDAPLAPASASAPESQPVPAAETQPATEEPVFHPGVENAADGEEVLP